MRDLPLPELGELAAQVGRNALLAAMLGAFGVAIGALVRNQIVAVVTLLVVMFVVEPVVLTLAPSVGRFGPLGALSVAAAGIPAEDAGLGDVRARRVPGRPCCCCWRGSPSPSPPPPRCSSAVTSSSRADE